MEVTIVKGDSPRDNLDYIVGGSAPAHEHHRDHTEVYQVDWWVETPIEHPEGISENEILTHLEESTQTKVGFEAE